MSMLRKIQRVGKRATKFQYTASYQSVVVECTKDKWRPKMICVSWTRRGRRFITKLRPWQPSPDNKARGVVIWPEPEVMEVTITLYKGPKDQSYESKEWDFAVIDVDEAGKRKVLATLPVNMVRYVSSLPYEHDIHLKLKPVSRKIKSVILDVSLTSEFLREGKATDDDMMSIASMMSISNLSTIGFLEDDEDDDYNYIIGSGRSITPPEIPDHILSTDELLKWAQNITKDLPDVKIINMTTSWRSGLGFLSIIHHYRPDLMLEFDLQSPNSIKENNRMAFNLARSLGVACPLTPNMMVTTTIPDKLAVTSFVYQMYQYFSKATQSAITRAKNEEERLTSSGEGRNRGTSPSSPFDLSKFEMFAGSNISPVTTPLPRPDRVMQYSRHSRENLQRQSQREAEMSPEEGEEEEKKEEQEGNKGLRAFGTNTSSEVCVQSTCVSTANGGGIPNGGAMDTTRDNHDLATMEDTNFKLDQIVTEHAQMMASDDKLKRADVSSRDQDRELEFENMNTDSESSRTESSTSILEEKSILELPSEINPINNLSSNTVTSSENISTYKYTPGSEDFNFKKVDKVIGRRLPSIPRDTSSPKLPDKRSDIRKKQAQEMLRKHKLDKFKLSPHNISTENFDTQNKYRKEAMNILSETFGTSVISRRSVNGDELSSEGSATSLGVVTTNDDDLSSRSADNLKVQPSLKKQTHDQEEPRQQLQSQGEENTSEATEIDRSRIVNGGDESSTHGKKPSSKIDSGTPSDTSKRNGLESGTEIASVNLLPASRRASDSNIIVNKTERELVNVPPNDDDGTSVHTSKQKKMLNTDLKRASDSCLPHPTSLSGDSNRQSGIANHKASRSNKKTSKPVPVVRPISAQPSHVLRRMAEQKKLEEDKEREEEREKQKLLDRGDKTDGKGEDEAENRNEDNSSERKDSVEISSGNHTPSHKKNLPSPSTWSQHSDDISQDLLQSQSEYVRTELFSLQSQVQDLEDRAQTTEGDIRGAMSVGNKETEEKLMQEWFGLLNKKNELIKRQIELNMIEKEEDLEKRQFFLNRELRPLMEIPEEQKTTQQKDRATHLLRELLELIDERDRLERRKMTNMRNTDRERLGLATAQAKSSGLEQNRSRGEMIRQGSKDCVIS